MEIIKVLTNGDGIGFGFFFGDVYFVTTAPVYLADGSTLHAIFTDKDGAVVVENKSGITRRDETLLPVAAQHLVADLLF